MPAWRSGKLLHPAELWEYLAGVYPATLMDLGSAQSSVRSAAVSAFFPGVQVPARHSWSSEVAHLTGSLGPLVDSLRESHASNPVSPARLLDGGRCTKENTHTSRRHWRSEVRLSGSGWPLCGARLQRQL